MSRTTHDRLLTDPEIWGYFQTTAYFVVLAVITQFIIGFGLALLLNREFRYKGLVTTLILLPMMLSPVVVGLFWRFIFASDTSGLVNYFLSPLLGGPIGWTTDPKIAMLAVVIVDTWMWSPFMMLISLAGLVRYPQVSLRSRRCRSRLPMVQVPLDHPAVGFPSATDRTAVPHDGCFQDVRYCLCVDPRRGTRDSDGNSFDEPVQTGVSELITPARRVRWLTYS